MIRLVGPIILAGGVIVFLVAVLGGQVGEQTRTFYQCRLKAMRHFHEPVNLNEDMGMPPRLSKIAWAQRAFRSSPAGMIQHANLARIFAVSSTSVMRRSALWRDGHIKSKS